MTTFVFPLGPYTITAENELGSDFALINVQVSDRPDPPRWPQTSQIGTDSLVLEWQVPNWDGGSAITNYVVEKQELPMTSWTRVGHTRYEQYYSLFAHFLGKKNQ